MKTEQKSHEKEAEVKAVLTGGRLSAVIVTGEDIPPVAFGGGKPPATFRPRYDDLICSPKVAGSARKKAQDPKEQMRSSGPRAQPRPRLPSPLGGGVAALRRAHVEPSRGCQGRAPESD